MRFKISDATAVSLVEGKTYRSLPSASGGGRSLVVVQSKEESAPVNIGSPSASREAGN